MIAMTPDLGCRQHLLNLFRSDEFLAGAVADFVHMALLSDDGAVLVATPQHLRQFRERLEQRGYEVSSLLEVGRLAALPAGPSLAALRAGGAFDAGGLQRVFGPTFEQVRQATGSPRVRVYGEMVDALAGQGEEGAALELERAWSEFLTQDRALTLLCGYHADGLDAGASLRLLPHCCVHQEVTVEGTARRARAIEAAIDEVLGAEEVARVAAVLRTEGLPAGEGLAEVTLLWLRARHPQLGDRVVVRARALLDLHAA